MSLYLSKTNLVVNVSFQIIFWIVIIVISAAVFQAPFNLVEFLTGKDTSKEFDFSELIPMFISDFLGIILLLFMGGIYYHFSSNSLESFKTILHNDFNKSFYKLKYILKKYSLITSINIIFLFLHESTLILVSLNIILVYFLISYVFKSTKSYYYIIFVSISYVILFAFPKGFYSLILYSVILFIFNFLIFFDSLKNKKIHYYIVYLLSFTLTIFTLDFNDAQVYLIMLFIFSFQITPFIYLILYLVKITFTYLTKIPVAEYTAASFAKQNITNKVILEFLNKECNEFKKVLPKELDQVLNIYQLALDKKGDFRYFLRNLNLSIENYNNIFSFYCLTPLPYENIKIKKTESVMFRNTNNLFVSIGILILFNVFYLASLLLFGTEFSQTLLKVAFSFIFIRLSLRSIEICFAFYNDIKPNVKLKRTYLSGSERITLALKSIIEVIILSTLLYMIHDILKVGSNFNFATIFKFFNILFDSFLKATAIAFFNISFEYKFTLFNIESFVSLVHLMQIISSVTLISISIANYLNLPKQHSDYELHVSNNKYFLYMKAHERNLYFPKITKKISSGDSIDSLLEDIQILWKDNKISYTQLEEIYEYLNIVYFKL
ncbi:hypothetical protein [Psychrobacillus sp. NPDC096389]|uniref:hypothetical protein n=1 Tax=Psychrobacillus sp. NPDC096389 TaxID=3364490 RepID=UPI0037FA168B